MAGRADHPGGPGRARYHRAILGADTHHLRTDGPHIGAGRRQIEKESADRNEAIVSAHASGVYSYQKIAEHFGMHFTSVGRIVRGTMTLIVRRGYNDRSLDHEQTGPYAKTDF